MSRWLKVVLAINLAVLAVLVFAYPALTVSPGPVQPAHAALQKDCFACHKPFLGADSNRCTTCHVPADIGRVSTLGVPLQKRTPFHQSLVRQDCMACHKEHAADRIGMPASAPVRFDHSLLVPAEAARCESCHQTPTNALHRQVKALPCTQCHTTKAWAPASFDHARLTAAQKNQCSTCHTRPTDTLHKQVGETCGQCHTTNAWKPATFDHDKYFPLDGDHNTTCATCHPGNNTQRYTCYGCHEHTPARIRAEHIEEGITNFLQCADCHGPRRKRAIGRGEREDD